MYWLNVSYDLLVPGASFTVREGPHIIGFNTVQPRQATTQPNKSLDASGGSVFRNLIGRAMLE